MLAAGPMERSAAAAPPVWRLRATGGHRDRDHPPPREEEGEEDDGGGDTGGKKRGGPRRRPVLPLSEGRGAPLVLLYLLGLRALVELSHRQLLSRPSPAGPRDFSAPRARYSGAGCPSSPGRAVGSRGTSPCRGQSPSGVTPAALGFPPGRVGGVLAAQRRPGPAGRVGAAGVRPGGPAGRPEDEEAAAVSRRVTVLCGTLVCPPLPRQELRAGAGGCRKWVKSLSGLPLSYSPPLKGAGLG